jgi:hypothetical protein
MTKRSTAKPEQAFIQPVTFSPYTIRRHHEQLAEWVAANGLDPYEVSGHHPIRVEQGDDGPVIRHHAFVRSTDGKIQTGDTNEVLATERTAPCTVPPPDLGASTTHDNTEAGE